MAMHQVQKSRRNAPRHVDPSGWVGSEYTPARAANTLWWARFEDYVDDVKRELGYARRALKLPAVRIFVHSLVWEYIGAALHAHYVDRFLDIAASNDIKVALVLFDDAWNHGANLPHRGNTGANISCIMNECCPIGEDGFIGVKGCHNSCWFANPQDHQRGDPSANVNASYLHKRFQPYIESVVKPLVDDDRVVFLEAFNEPCEWSHYEANICTLFQVETSTILKEAAFHWIKALRPQQPVISCWDKANNTFSDLLEVHLYNSDFQAWNAHVFAECSHGTCNRTAVVTEAGARWYQGLMQDAGSPLTVLNYLDTLRRGDAPFVPGVMLAWELMAGNSNTRWQSGPPCEAPTALTREPAIPWCGLLWPDGTPVSFTEAGAIRRYLTGRNPFLLFENFLQPSANLTGDQTLNLTANGEVWHRAIPLSAVGGAMYETSVWLGEANSRVELAIGNEVRWIFSVTTESLRVSAESRGHARHLIASFDTSAMKNGVLVGAWNLLRVKIDRFTTRSDTITVWLNPEAHPTEPKLGRIQPRIHLLSAISTRERPSLARVSLQATGDGFVLVDYISVLPPDGGLDEAEVSLYV